MSRLFNVLRFVTHDSIHSIRPPGCLLCLSLLSEHCQALTYKNVLQKREDRRLIKITPRKAAASFNGGLR